MAKVNITQASKIAKISRSTLYNKYIKTGIISIEKVDDKKLIDISELMRVFTTLQLDNQIIHNNTPNYIVNTDNKDMIITMLEVQLAEAKKREEWLKQQLDKTTNLLGHKPKLNRKKFLGIF